MIITITMPFVSSNVDYINNNINTYIARNVAGCPVIIIIIDIYIYIYIYNYIYIYICICV